MSGLGHLPQGSDKGSDPLESYNDFFRQGPSLPGKPWIVSPEWLPCKVQGMEAFQQWFECHAMPRYWQLLIDLWIKFQCGLYFIKHPNWIEPPITARCIDCRNEDPVPLSGPFTVPP